MAQQPTDRDDSKVALDMADLPLPELEEEEEQAPVAAAAETDFDPSLLAPDEDEKRGLPKLVLIGGGALILLVLLAAVWFFFLRSGEDEAAPEPEPELVVSRPVGPPRATLEPFIIPVKPDPRGRLLKLVVMLEFDSVEDMDITLEGNTPVIRDAIYRAFRNRSLEDINSARLNNVLPVQLKEYINKALGENIIKQIYFPDFLFAG